MWWLPLFVAIMVGGATYEAQSDRLSQLKEFVGLSQSDATESLTT